jgi:hypothetical protein
LQDSTSTWVIGNFSTGYVATTRLCHDYQTMSRLPGYDATTRLNRDGKSLSFKITNWPVDWHTGHG